MDVRVLGPVEVRDRHLLSIGGPRQRRIMAALVMHANSVVSVDRLTEITWPYDELPDQAVSNLRSYVYRIRSSLGETLEDRIITQPPGYQLRVDDDEVDYLRFERLVDRADRVAAKGDPGSALAYVDEALKLWHGEPYEEFAGEPWVIAEAVRLEELRARARERRCDALIELDRSSEAITALNSLIDEHPYRERPRRLLMVALYLTGRQTEALRGFHEFRQILVEEMGIDPSEELTDLERQILQQDPTLRQIADRKRTLRSYQLDEVIGEGAFAMVWRGTQPDLGREVAVKQIRTRFANDPDFIRRFEVEAQLVSTLEHPHIVPLYDYWREPDAAFLVMRMLKGGTLAQRLTTGPLQDKELVRLVHQIGPALRLAHRAGVIHRDVKPANVLLDDEGNFYLTDFGIAFGVEGEDDVAAALSTGTPPYAAPEQLRREPLDARTDLYSFGVTMFEAATGVPPYAADNDAELLRLQLEADFPVPSAVTPGLPAWVDEVIARSTTISPAERYHEIDELILDVSPEHSLERRGSDAVVAEREQAVGRNPFKGLRAFQESDAADFHGRKRLTARLIEVLRRPGSDGRLVAVVGPSGSGKSSSIRAGLLPALRAGAVPGSDRWYMATMVPGAQPFAELERVLAPIATIPPDQLAAAMSHEERGIGDAVNRALPDDESSLLLVIDQFEELFTQADATTTNRFLQGLIVAIREPRTRLRVVLTVRADFWDRPLEHTRLATMLETASVTISPLAADELEQAIVAPAADEGVDYEPGLVARIGADVADQPGALPLLQFALTELFDRAESGRISAMAYDEIGGLAGALAQRAEGVYLEFDAPQREACRRLFSRLVALREGVDDTRRRILVSELGSDSGVAGVVEALGSARLLIFDRDPVTRMPTVEIAHEALIPAWPRLRDWIDDDRDVIRSHRQLTTAATEWQRTGHDTDDLYRGGRLETALALQGNDPAMLNETERAFVDASSEQTVAVQRRSRRRTRILQSLLGLTTMLLVVALVATLVAVDSAGDADAARDDALTAGADLREERDELIATQQDLEIEVLRGQLADLAEQGSPVLPSLLAVELHRLDPSAASLGSMADALLAKPGWKGTIPGVWIDQSALGPWVITIEASAVVVRDPDDLSEVRRIPVDAITGASGQAPLIPVLDPEGRRIAIGQSRGIRIVDLASGDVGSVIETNVGFDQGRAIAWTSDGKALVVISGPQHLDVLAIDDLAASPLVTSYDVGEPIEPWVVAHPTEARIVIAPSSGLFLNVDISRLSEGSLIRTPSSNDFPPLAIGVRLSQPGRSVDAVFGGTTVFDPGPLIATITKATSDVPFGWVEPLSDGTTFAGGGLGIPAILADSTGKIVGGPWQPGDDIEAFVQPVLVAGGDEVAVVLMGARDGSGPTIHRFSRVGGDALSETLPSLPVSATGRPYYLPGANVAVSVGAWTFIEDGPVQLELGVSVEIIAAASTDLGDVVIVADRSGRITVHEVPSGRLLSPGGSKIRVENILSPLQGTGLSLSSDGRTLVVVSVEPFEIHVFDLATGGLRESFPIGGVQGGITSVRAGKAVIQGRSTPSRLVESLVIDLDTLVEDYRGPLEIQDVTADGDLLLAGRDPVQLVDPQTLEVIWSGPSGITPLHLHASDEYVFADNFLHFRVIDVESATVVGPVIRGRSRYAGQGVAIQRDQGRLHLRNADPDTWWMAACEAAGRNLTRAEWEKYLPAGVEYAPSCSQWSVDS